MAFKSGQHGRGPTPFHTSMSRKPAGLKTHKATSGRGMSGVQGGGRDSHEEMTDDIEHPQSHSGFEALGVGGSEE
jgi:hypothetical protein